MVSVDCHFVIHIPTPCFSPSHRKEFLNAQITRAKKSMSGHVLLGFCMFTEMKYSCLKLVTFLLTLESQEERNGLI
jgi:hypothetical protein